MASIEERIKYLEDRLALQDALTRYCTCVDSLNDIDGLLDCFTSDALFDLSGIGLPKLQGHAALRGFFEPLFSDMSHHAHFNTNFTVERLDGDEAICQAYVMGMGASKDGQQVLVYVKYFLTYTRLHGAWKILKFGEAALMPLPGSLTDMHGDR